MSAAKPLQRTADQGTLKIVSAEDATVYVNGIAVGSTNRPVDVRCGRFFVRIGVPTPLGTRWLRPGQTVVIGCGAVSELVF